MKAVGQASRNAVWDFRKPSRHPLLILDSAIHASLDTETRRKYVANDVHLVTMLYTRMYGIPALHSHQQSFPDHETIHSPDSGFSTFGKIGVWLFVPSLFISPYLRNPKLGYCYVVPQEFRK